jgi:hypothetical protein
LERSLPAAVAAPLLAHVALCARCRREYAETSELARLAAEVRALEAQAATSSAVGVGVSPDPIAKPSLLKRWVTRNERAPENVAARSRSAIGWFSPGLGFTLGAAAAGAALYFTTTTPARLQRDRLAVNLQDRNAALARAEQGRRGMAEELAAVKRQRDLDAARLTQEMDRLRVQVRSQSLQVAQLEAAETTLREMPLPTAEWMLSRSDGQVRGVGGGEMPVPEIVLLRPAGTATVETRPILECGAVPGASSYQAHLEIEGSEEEAPALRPLSATRWTPVTALRPGTVYRWAVTAQRGDALLHSSLVKFYVLSESQRREVEGARRRYAGNLLTIGALYARLGMLPEAEEQFRAAAKANANPVAAAVARRWLGELKARK